MPKGDDRFIGRLQSPRLRVPGCVPVYRAHPTVRESYLEGARWSDPAEYGRRREGL